MNEPTIHIKRPETKLSKWDGNSCSLVEYGDILYGEKLLSAVVDPKDLVGRNVILPPDNGLGGFGRMGIDISWLKDCMYECPYLPGNKYFWMLPVAVLSDDQSRYYQTDGEGKVPYHSTYYERKFVLEEDHEHCCGEQVSFEELRRENKINLCLMGHGYTSYTLPSDGGGEVKLGLIPLDNGDELLVLVWVWYNK